MRLQDYRGLCAILVTLQYFGVLRLCRSHCRDYSVQTDIYLWAGRLGQGARAIAVPPCHSYGASPLYPRSICRP